MNSALKGMIGDLRSFVSAGTPSRTWDWQSAVLTVALVQIASARLAITEWVPFLGITQTISLYAVLLGLALGYSSFVRRQAIWTAIEYGLLLIPIQLLTATELTDNYYNDTRNLFIRLFDAFSLFLQNQPVYDTLFFVLLTSVGFWVVGAYAGYRLMRHDDFLDVALAPGLVVLIVQIYDPWMPLRAWGLAVYIFVALALLGRMHYLNNKTHWRKKHVFLSSDSEWEFSRSVVSAAGIVVFIAWALPGALTSVKPAAEAWRNFTQPIIERLSDAVSALDSPYGSSPGGDFYGTDLKLGSNAPVSDAPVFYVEVKDSDVEVLRYYWRGRVYDQYENGQWANTSIRRQDFDPQQDEILLADPFKRTEADFLITMNFPKQDLLYAPSEIVWVDREARLAVNLLPGEAREVTAWLADPGLVAGDNYEVRTMIANPTIQDLRAAGTQYPEWVTERYLQVPPEMEPRLSELADQITSNYNIPYDKVQAITSYLRHTIQYELKITEAPSQGEDPLLWVLFDYKKGFCMYYASAEVLLLRSIGIPARMAVGFAEGEYDEDRGRYTVARLNSHAWPEVYFPGIGWVEFEPTANQDPLDRPLEQIETVSENETGANLQNNPPAIPDEGLENLPGFDPTLNEDQNPPLVSATDSWERFLLPMFSLATVAIAIFLARYYSLTERLPVYLAGRYAKSGNHPPRWLSNWVKWAGLRPIERAFHIINLSLRWLGERVPAHATPAERAGALAKSLPAADQAIHDLAHEHQTALFTSRSANLSLARRAGMKILFETWRTRIFRYGEYLKRRYN